jgi:hypothetical protein
METKKESKKNTYGSVFAISVILGVLLLSSLNTIQAEPPIQENDCLIYGYTSSGEHYFLMRSGSSMFGTNITFENDCQKIDVYVNGNYTASSFNSSDLKINLEPGVYDISIISENNRSLFFNNITVYPNALTWVNDYNEWKYPNLNIEEYISMTSAIAKENWASILSIVIVFVLVTYVYWNLINSYVDRNFIEEVKK